MGDVLTNAEWLKAAEAGAPACPANANLLPPQVNPRDSILSLSYWVEAGVEIPRPTPPTVVRPRKRDAFKRLEVAVVKKVERMKKPAEVKSSMVLFNMDPPPPTPVEDRKLEYYGSKYDRWRGMRF